MKYIITDDYIGTKIVSGEIKIYISLVPELWQDILTNAVNAESWDYGFDAACDGCSPFGKIGDEIVIKQTKRPFSNSATFGYIETIAYTKNAGVEIKELENLTYEDITDCIYQGETKIEINNCSIVGNKIISDFRKLSNRQNPWVFITTIGKIK